MTNMDVRLKMFEMNVKQWQVAEIMGIDASTLCRKLRKELSDSEKKKIISAIEDVYAMAH